MSISIYEYLHMLSIYSKMNIVIFIAHIIKKFMCFKYLNIDISIYSLWIKDEHVNKFSEGFVWEQLITICPHNEQILSNNQKVHFFHINSPEFFFMKKVAYASILCLFVCISFIYPGRECTDLADRVIAYTSIVRGADLKIRQISLRNIRL